MELITNNAIRTTYSDSSTAWQWGTTNKVKLQLKVYQRELFTKLGLMQPSSAYTASNASYTFIEHQVRGQLGKLLLEWGERDLRGALKAHPHGTKLALGTELYAHHAQHKRQLIAHLLGIEENNSSTAVNFSGIEPLFPLNQGTPQQQRRQLHQRLEQALQYNIKYAIKHHIRAGLTDRYLVACIRLVKNAPDHALSNSHLALNAPQTESKADLGLEGGAELLGAVHYYNQCLYQPIPGAETAAGKLPATSEEKKQTSENLHQQYAAYHHYHSFKSSQLARFLDYWLFQFPITTTLGLLASTTIAAMLYVPTVMQAVHSSWLIAQLRQLLWGCSAFTAQGLLMIAVMGLLWGGIYLLNKHLLPNHSTQTLRASNHSAPVQPAQRTATLDTDNLFVHNPIRRLFCGIQFLFHWLYDYGRSNPMTMALFGIFYWFPAALILINIYGGVTFTGPLALIYNYAVLPVANGLVSLTVAPWISALCVGFLYGKGMVLLLNTINQRSRGGLWQTLKKRLIAIFDTLVGIAGLFFLGRIVAGFPALERGSGSWETFNFMTLTIKPALMIYDILSNPSQSIVGSAFRCVFLVPFWAFCPLFGSTGPKMGLHGEAQLKTCGQRLNRVVNDLWAILRDGVYELLVGLVLRDIVYGILHILFNAGCRLVAGLCTVFRCHNAADAVVDFEFASHRIIRNGGIVLDSWLRQKTGQIKAKHFLGLMLVLLLVPSMVSLWFTGHILHLAFFDWAYLSLKHLSQFWLGAPSPTTLVTCCVVLVTMWISYSLLSKSIQRLNFEAEQRDGLFWTCWALVITCCSGLILFNPVLPFQSTTIALAVLLPPALLIVTRLVVRLLFHSSKRQQLLVSVCDKMKLNPKQLQTRLIACNMKPNNFFDEVAQDQDEAVNTLLKNKALPKPPLI